MENYKEVLTINNEVGLALKASMRALQHYHNHAKISVYFTLISFTIGNEGLSRVVLQRDADVVIFESDAPQFSKFVQLFCGQQPKSLLGKKVGMLCLISIPPFYFYDVELELELQD